MERLPGVYPSIGDGALGTVASFGDSIRGVVGVSSLGTDNQLMQFSDPDAVADNIGVGPGADAVIDHLRLGGGVVYFVKATGSVAGTITPGASNPATPAVTVTGTPNQAVELVVTVTKGGAIGTSEFTYSLDGGDTVVGPIATAATYVLTGTGLTLNFAAGTYILDDVYSFVVTAPTASTADISTAMQVLIDSNLLFRYIHVAQPGDNSLWTVLDTQATDAENNFRYCFILAEAPGPDTGQTVDAWVTELTGYKTSFSSKRVLICAPWAEVADVRTSRFPNRSLASRLGARLSARPISENPGWVQQGPVQGMIIPMPFTENAFGKVTSYTNAHALTLQNAGFTTIHKIIGRDGWYWVDGRMAAPDTSDFASVMNRSVMDKACTLVRQALLDFVQKGVKPTDLESSLADLVARAKAPLRLMAADGDIETGNVVIPAGQDILSTKKLRVQVRVVPLGYLSDIVQDIAFENPLLLPPVVAPATPADAAQ